MFCKSITWHSYLFWFFVIWECLLCPPALSALCSPQTPQFTSRDCPDKITTLEFFQLLLIYRSCSISTHSVRMVWHWDPGRSVCVGR